MLRRIVNPALVAFGLAAVVFIVVPELPFNGAPAAVKTQTFCQQPHAGNAPSAKFLNGIHLPTLPTIPPINIPCISLPRISIPRITLPTRRTTTTTQPTTTSSSTTSSTTTSSTTSSTSTTSTTVLTVNYQCPSTDATNSPVGIVSTQEGVLYCGYPGASFYCTYNGYTGALIQAGYGGCRSTATPLPET